MHTLNGSTNLTRKFIQKSRTLRVFQCDKFASCGEEAIFLVVNKSDGATSYQATKMGMDFLDMRSDVMDDFAKFCKGTGSKTL